MSIVCSQVSKILRCSFLVLGLSVQERASGPSCAQRCAVGGQRPQQPAGGYIQHHPSTFFCPTVSAIIGMSASQEQVSSMTDEVIKKDVAYPISTVPDTGFTYLCCPLKVIIHNLRQDLTGLRAASVHSVPNQRSQSVFDNIFHGMQ